MTESYYIQENAICEYVIESIYKENHAAMIDNNAYIHLCANIRSTMQH